MEARIDLSQYHLKKTEIRTKIVNVLSKHDSIALSEQEISQRLKPSFDRVSVYRTIKTFLDHGIIHKIACNDGTVRYALSEDEARGKGHVHFQCVTCGQVTCLAGKVPPSAALPRGYRFVDAQFLVQGECPRCQK